MHKYILTYMLFMECVTFFFKLFMLYYITDVAILLFCCFYSLQCNHGCESINDLEPIF